MGLPLLLPALLLPRGLGGPRRRGPGQRHLGGGRRSHRGGVPRRVVPHVRPRPPEPPIHRFFLLTASTHGLNSLPGCCVPPQHRKRTHRCACCTPVLTSDPWCRRGANLQKYRLKRQLDDKDKDGDDDGGPGAMVRREHAGNTANLMQPPLTSAAVPIRLERGRQRINRPGWGVWGWG